MEGCKCREGKVQEEGFLRGQETRKVQNAKLLLKKNLIPVKLQTNLQW